MQAGSPVKESSFLHRETSAEELEEGSSGGCGCRFGTCRRWQPGGYSHPPIKGSRYTSVMWLLVDVPLLAFCFWVPRLSESGKLLNSSFSCLRYGSSPSRISRCASC
ncbi:hypothetical protein VTK73DRAFT_5002 [Phialemonium thermophilum]|uniref:Uncharacterized protein n=1 Tax=Phialemonium thermophilum TaxID=223376 RepID=A0ABR3V4D9_9PEZI